MFLNNGHITLLITALLLLSGACAEKESGKSQSDNKSGLPQDPSAYKISPNDVREAALQGQIALVKEAIEQDFLFLDQSDELGRTALMLASFNGHTEIARYLIEQGAELDKNDSEGRTALMFAASGPFPETVELLLKEGADVNSPDSSEGWSALMFAASEGNQEVVQILLKYDADISLKDNDGETAIDFAENSGHEEVATLLKDNKYLPMRNK